MRPPPLEPPELALPPELDAPPLPSLPPLPWLPPAPPLLEPPVEEAPPDAPGVPPLFDPPDSPPDLPPLLPFAPPLPLPPPLPWGPPSAPDWQDAPNNATETNSKTPDDTLAAMFHTAAVALFCSGKRAIAAVFALVAASCAETRNLGTSVPHGRLPVDDRNPVILSNDGAYDNWQGEYAVLLAQSGGPSLAGIIVNRSSAWMDLDANIDGWRGLVKAARDSGLKGIPDPIASVGGTLARPSSSRIEDTMPIQSEGARLIRDLSRSLSLPYRPLVVATGGRLTDVADAYLMDPTVAERVVVVSSLGTTTSSGAAMAAPNGEMDPWADFIVTTRLRYVQVSAYYDQTTDVPSSRLSDLPPNALGAWIAAKQPKIFDLAVAADQVAIAAVGISTFVTAVQPVSAAGSVSAGAGPDLVADAESGSLLVTHSQGREATVRFWQLLLDASTYAR